MNVVSNIQECNTTYRWRFCAAREGEENRTQGEISSSASPARRQQGSTLKKTGIGYLPPNAQNGNNTRFGTKGGKYGERV